MLEGTLPGLILDIIAEESLKVPQNRVQLLLSACNHIFLMAKLHKYISMLIVFMKQFRCIALCAIFSQVATFQDLHAEWESINVCLETSASRRVSTVMESLTARTNLMKLDAVSCLGSFRFSKLLDQKT